MELKPELVIADRFRLVRLLGEGGMGSVWLADHIRLQTPCAVKFMRPEVAAEPTYRVRFDREAKASAQIRSPHVVHILDHGVWEGAPYIAMEYLEGEDLAHRLSRRKKLTPEETVEIVGQVARALTKAHAAGLVHRDLKPGNIFLVRDDDREIVKVLDFGVAKSQAAVESGHTKTGAIVGTPFYMSPEQAQGTKQVDHRTDLWALGVVTFLCLTGELPFMSDAFGDLVLKIIVEPLPVPSKVGPVPPGFDAWWARAVSRDPAGRFQSAKELADALAEALDVRAAGGVGAATALLGADTPRGEIASLNPKTPARSEASARSGLAASPSGGAMEASVGAPSRDRSLALFLGALAVIAVIGAGAYLGLRARSAPPGPSTVAEPSPPPSSPPPAVTSAAPPEVRPAVEASAAPSASASAAAEASAAPSASAVPSASARRPLGKLPGAKHAPSAAPTGHDIGF